MFRFVFLCLSLLGCALHVPPEFTYQEIQTPDFTLAGWQKITDPSAPYKIYIEGDGYAFNEYGRPTRDPTPRGHLMRELAFTDPAANVVYLARPCQFIKSGICAQRHWTTARFAPEVIKAEYAAIKQIAPDSPLILVGFSGGGQVAGLLAVTKPDLNVVKVVTIAGNLDHETWARYHQVPPLSESLNLADYQTRFAQIPQIHYVGEKDTIVPPFLVQNFVADPAWVIEVSGATHSKGWLGKIRP